MSAEYIDSKYKKLKKEPLKYLAEILKLMKLVYNIPLTYIVFIYLGGVPYIDISMAYIVKYIIVGRFLELILLYFFTYLIFFIIIKFIIYDLFQTLFYKWFRKYVLEAYQLYKLGLFNKKTFTENKKLSTIRYMLNVGYKNQKNAKHLLNIYSNLFIGVIFISMFMDMAYVGIVSKNITLFYSIKILMILLILLSFFNSIMVQLFTAYKNVITRILNN